MKNKVLLFAFISSGAVFSFAQGTVENLSPSNENTQVSNTTQSTDMSRLQNEQDKFVIRDQPNSINLSKEMLNSTAKNAKSKGVTYTIPSSNPVIDPSVSANNLLLKDAFFAFKNKKYDDCIEYCDYILGINRNSSEAYFLKGVSYYGLNDTDIAIKFLKIAVGKGSKDAQEVLKDLEK